MATKVKIKVERNYERQEKLKLKVPEGVIIVGCGGTGTWSAIALLLAGTRNFVLVDEDELANHNLNRLPYAPENVGLQKTRVLKNLMEIIEPSVDCVELWRMAAPEEKDDTQVSFDDYFNMHPDFTILDCTDDLKIQQHLSKLCKTHKRDYLRVGCDDSTIYVGTLVPSGEFAGDMKQGYATPSYVSTPMIAGALAVRTLCGAPEISIVGGVK